MLSNPFHLERDLASSHKRVRHLISQILASNRFAIIGLLLFGIALPELFHPLVSTKFSWAIPIHMSDPMLYATAIALLIGHLCLRQTSPLPFVDAKVLILPVFAITFGMVAIIIATLFDTISYYHFPTGFIGGIVWYIALTVMRGRLIKPVIALVGISDIEPTMRATRVIWVPWANRHLPRKADAIVYDSNKHYSDEWERFFARAVLRNIPVYDLDHMREMTTGRVRLRSKPELVFGQLLPSQPYLRIKRLCDFAFALIVLPLAIPILIVATLIIRAESPGSILFRQTRVGYQGRLFTCYKLRTMRNDIAGPLYTQENDPRITAIGRFLRKSRIDELPQIFNVLKGDMSWIGPRPEALGLSRDYEKNIPYYRYRHSVRPGISGWAAVHQGNVALTDAATRKLEYDFYYIKYFSIWLDFIIGLMTIRTMLTGFGSR